MIPRISLRRYFVQGILTADCEAVKVVFMNASTAPRCLHCHRVIAAANLVKAPPAGFAHRACEVKYGKPNLTILPQTDRQKAMTRAAIGEASDHDRVLLARKSRDGKTMIGPDEHDQCDKHPDQVVVTRWTWDVPEDGDHDAAIACSEPDIVSECPKCAEESEAAWREEIGDV